MTRTPSLEVALLLIAPTLAACGSMWSDARAPVTRTETMIEFQAVAPLGDARIAVVATDAGSEEARDAVATTLSGGGLAVVDAAEADVTIEVTVEVLAEDGHAARVLIAAPDPGEYAVRLAAAAHVDDDGTDEAAALVVEEAAALSGALVDAVRGRSREK